MPKTRSIKLTLFKLVGGGESCGEGCQRAELFSSQIGYKISLCLKHI